MPDYKKAFEILCRKLKITAMENFRFCIMEKYDETRFCMLSFNEKNKYKKDFYTIKECLEECKQDAKN